MKLIIFILFYQLSIGHGSRMYGYNLYHTDSLSNNLDRDCFIYFPKPVQFSYQFIPYCIRYQLNEEAFKHEENENAFTFEELGENDVTSEQLYHWSAPIDLIEHYQYHLENENASDEFVFYNCTYPWFGSRCEYRLEEMDFNLTVAFRETFDKTSPVLSEMPTLSCYVHLHWSCSGNENQTTGECLDWREICDGKIDCINGAYDEEFCWRLELNECEKDTEFRCYNGLCIPSAFLTDDVQNPDCLDRSDEPLSTIDSFGQSHSVHAYLSHCLMDPAFRCEEHRCHPLEYKRDITECGDGTCSDRQKSCHNERLTKVYNDFWLRVNTPADCRRHIECYVTLVTKVDYQDYCSLNTFQRIRAIREHCPEMIRLPSIFFGHVQIVFINDQSKVNQLPTYICYDARLCDQTLFSTNFQSPIDLFGDNSTCRLFNITAVYNETEIEWKPILQYLYSLFYKCSNYYQPSISSQHSHLYQCANSSKLISKHRLLDGIEDCPHGDDELYTESCSLTNFNHRFKCDEDKNVKCLARFLVSNKQVDCSDQSDEYGRSNENLQTKIAFQTICDGYNELVPITIEGYNHTDETECTYFPCNNTYTRCNYYWNCPDGADEVNCEWPPRCPPLHHMCFTSTELELTCLPLNRTNDGILDCVGAFDERQHCRNMYKAAHGTRYQCSNSSKCIGSGAVCLGTWPCSDNRPYFLEQHCTEKFRTQNILCRLEKNLTYAQQYFCSLTDDAKKASVYFSLTSLTSYPPIQTLPSTEVFDSPISTNNEPGIDNGDIRKWQCNRGLVIHRRMNKENNTQLICFCPPAYYGHLCQYQNQRVSLTFQVKATFDFRTLFAVIITLRDDEQNRIQSYEQLNYLYERDCEKKFNIYLLYNTRPKNMSTNYSVHIDIFDKHSIKHRASWLFPIRFFFLPVYRLAIQLEIPSIIKSLETCPMLNCGNHVQCSQYVNTLTFFCLCEKDWTGKYCHIPYVSRCSPNSTTFSPNICICPMGKFGPRCYLTHPSCSCENNGTCMSDDERTSEKQENRCICPKGFSGARCATRDTTLTVSFAPEISIPSHVLIHFIRVFDRNTPHNRSSTLKMIAPDQEILSISWSKPFHIVLIETMPSKVFYLTVLQPIYLPSTNISTTLKLTDRCWNITELLNKTILEWHLIRRVKYYHRPCQERSNLSCFYDELHMCICNQTLRQANCMKFDHTVSYECESSNFCENNGTCFRDRPNCPNAFMCICKDCSYGPQCEISTKGTGLSLDVILGYQFRPNLSYAEQRSIIHFTTITVTCMLVFGIVSGVLSIITFHQKKTRVVGCGYYLLASSYISIIAIIIFALKYYFLLVSQLNMITNRSYLKFNCIVFEYSLKIFLSIGDWFNAFVGIERAYAAWKDTKFDQKRSRYLAKRIIIFTCLIVVVTYLHDPIHRDLINDLEEDRTWCHVKHSKLLRWFNQIILGFHFIVPFALNICSAVFIIIFTARQKSLIRKERNYEQHLRKQFYTFKHLFISSMILVSLALPRLIISFVSGCMKTAREDPWLYLIGYLISFLPPMMIVFVFIFPSELYKIEFRNTLAQIKLRLAPRRS